MIKLIIGLGNPDINNNTYKNTRHNIGAYYVELLASLHKTKFIYNSKFQSSVAKFQYNDDVDKHEVFLLKPQTYMNLSGTAVSHIMQFYKIIPAEILVIHDDLDLNCGVIKLKQGGGSGGHNGLNDISKLIGQNYWRLRIGIGRPHNKNIAIADYVLMKINSDELLVIDKSITNSLSYSKHIFMANFAYIMRNLHTAPT